MLIARSKADEDVIFRIDYDGVTVCGERARDPLTILGALFGFGVGPWPRTPKSRA